MNTQQLELSYEKALDHGNRSHNYAWGAIFYGAIMAVGLTFLFNLLTLGLGLTLYTKNDHGQQILTFMGLAWMMIGSYITLFIAGWTTGSQVGKSYEKNTCAGMAYGFLAWSVYLLISFIVIAQLSDHSSLAYFRQAFLNISAGTATPTHNLTTNELGLATLSTFLIFTIGALGCAVGGACGLKAIKSCASKGKVNDWSPKNPSISPTDPSSPTAKNESSPNHSNIP